MIKKLIPIIALLIAAGGGLFAGEKLRGDDHDAGKSIVTADGAEKTSGGHGAEKTSGGHGAENHGKKGGREIDYFRFPTQFFVPVMHGDRLDGIMILTLTIEAKTEDMATIHHKEFRLRDGFLQTLLIHANTGGFDGNFTTEPHMRRLREALMKTAGEISGGTIKSILIEDIIRQDSA